MIYAYDDPKGWGRGVAKYGAKLFTDPADVPSGAKVFIRLDQQAERRDIGKTVHAALIAKGCIITPSEREAAWYDNKVLQHSALRDWMPETVIHTSLESALNDDREFPFISKAAEGASSANVRLIESSQQAANEARQAFGDGVKLKYDRIQKGYVYWQRFAPDNPCDYRVIIIGNHFYGAVQDNRPGTVFASGSGKGRVLDLSTERELRALRLAEEISQAVGIDWTAFDIVFDGDKPLVTEMSCSWGIRLTRQSPVFDRKTRKDTGMKAGDVIHRLAFEYLKGK